MGGDCAAHTSPIIISLAKKTNMLGALETFAIKPKSALSTRIVKHPSTCSHRAFQSIMGVHASSTQPTCNHLGSMGEEGELAFLLGDTSGDPGFYPGGDLGGEGLPGGGPTVTLVLLVGDSREAEAGAPDADRGRGLLEGDDGERVSGAGGLAIALELARAVRGGGVLEWDNGEGVPGSGLRLPLELAHGGD